MQVSDAPRSLPTGTVTLLFTDIEGSSARWETHRDAMRSALDRHDTLLRSTVESNQGTVFKTIGDAFCAVFATASDAIAAAYSAQRELQAEDWAAVGGLRVRMAVHTGPADLRESDYFGPTVNRVARLISVGHGGQVLVSGVAKELAEGCMPPQATLRDLGAHRLKDLTHPEQIYQLIAPGLEVEFPPLRSLESLPNNLPLQLTTFIGREEDVKEVKQMLESSRLVTLVGAGGVGKTRLSLQVGADVLERFEDGVWFIELAPLADPQLVTATIAAVFGVRQQPDQPLLQTVGAALRSKRALLILDNCEHVVEEAAHVADALLHSGPQIRILASSREGLGIEGEGVLRVPSLSFPGEDEQLDVARGLQYGAIALFIDRAKAADRRFTPTGANLATIAEICRQLDGIALAIELAAPRVKVLSVEQLAARLNERFRILTSGSRTALPRQQTMRALIDWSYDLLSENEQTIFRRIGVFAGTFSIDAAGELCADETIEAWDVLEILSSLVDKSLVVSELAGSEQRYRLLVSTRQYALERLEEDGELQTMQRSHAEYYAGVAERADKKYYTTSTRRWLTAIEQDMDNMRVAMDWAFSESGDAELGVRITAPLMWYWAVGQRATEASNRVRQALEAADGMPPSQDHVRLLIAMGYTGGNLLMYGVQREMAERALEIAEAIDDREGVALALMAIVGARFTDPQYAFEPVIERASAIWAQLGNRRMVGTCKFLRARTHFVLEQDVHVAAPLFEEALRIARSTGDERTLAVISNNMAEMEFEQGNIDAAIRLVGEASLYAEALRSYSLQSTNRGNLAAYLIARGDYDAALAAAREGLRLALDMQTVAFRILGLHFSVVAAAHGAFETSARLLGSGLGCYRRSGSEIEPTERRLRDRTLALLEPHFAPDDLQALMAEGVAWDDERAIEEMFALG